MTVFLSHPFPSPSSLIPARPSPPSPSPSSELTLSLPIILQYSNHSLGGTHLVFLGVFAVAGMAAPVLSAEEEQKREGRGRLLDEAASNVNHRIDGQCRM